LVHSLTKVGSFQVTASKIWFKRCSAAASSSKCLNWWLLAFLLGGVTAELEAVQQQADSFLLTEKRSILGLIQCGQWQQPTSPLQQLKHFQAFVSFGAVDVVEYVRQYNGIKLLSSSSRDLFDTNRSWSIPCVVGTGPK